MLYEEGLDNVFAAMTAMPRSRGAPCAPGGWRCGAPSPALSVVADGGVDAGGP